MTARRDPIPTRTLGLLLAIAVVAATAFVGVAAGANVTTADRTIERTELEPGESTAVTVDVELDGTDDPAVYERFDPAFERVEVTGTEPDIDAVNDGNDEFVAIWEETDAATLEYEVTVPEDAENGDTFAISGEAESADGATTVAGDAEIDVVTDEFEVSIAETNESVEQGEPLETTATIENTGGLEGTQDVEFLFNGTVSATEENVTLAAGNATNVTFTHDTGDIEPGAYDVEVRSDDDADARNVTVTEADESDGSDGSGDDSDSGSPSSPSSPDDAFFDVTIADADESVKAGDRFVANATVENTGDETGTQDIEFLFDGVVKTVEEDVTIDGGEAETVTFTADLAVEPGEYEVAIKSDDDGATTTVTVVESKGDGTDTESGTGDGDEKSDDGTDADDTDGETDESDEGSDGSASADDSAANDETVDTSGDSEGDSDDSTPGFGVPAVVVAAALAVLVGLRRDP